ncbi:zinc finger, CCHC-type containing protein [Tanacetum coccineum]
MTTNQTTNNSIKSILKKEKLNGSIFLDWYRNLGIVLGHEQKLHHLEEAFHKAPPSTAIVVVLYAYTRRVAEQQEVACLMFVSMTPEIQKNLEDRTAFDILQELKTMFQQQAEQELFETRIGYPMPLVFGVNLILTSLSKDYDQFVQNYNIHGMGRPYLNYMPCSNLQRRGLRGIRKLNKGALDLYVGNDNRAVFEAIGSFDLILLSGMFYGLWCYFSSKDNLFYFNDIPRDSIFEIDMHNHVSNERSICTCSNKKSKHNLDSTFLWHCRLSHINKKRIAKLQHDRLLKSIDDDSLVIKPTLKT